MAVLKGNRHSESLHVQPIAEPSTRLVATLAAIFGLSAVGLGWEITLTRLASAALAYHYAFVAVSLAVGGIGLGAAAVYALPVAFARVAAASAAGAGIALLLVPLVLSPVAANFSLGGLIILGVPPFILIGGAVTATFRTAPHWITKYYAADLVGAGTGAVGTIFALNAVGPVALIFVLAAVAAISSGLLVRPATLYRRLDGRTENAAKGQRFALPVLAGVLVVAGVIGAVTQIATGTFGIDYRTMVNAPPDKTIVTVLRDRSQDAHIIDTRWNAFARTDVVATADPAHRLIFTDGGAGTYMVRWNGSLRSAEGLRQNLETVPFLLGTHRNVLVIGSGGGIDVLRALVAGAKHVTAVDWNRAAIAEVRHERTYDGNLLDRPDVTTVVDDGRHFLARSKQRYDTILLNLVYTGAAQGTTDALAENYIFTTQAFQVYLRHLTPGGRIGIISHQALEGLRAFTTGIEALHKQKLPYADAMQRVALLMTDNQTPEARPTLTIVQRSPFNNRELIYLRSRGTGNLNLRPLFVPSLYQGAFGQMVEGTETLSQFLQGSDYNVGPTTDNQPFFFDLNLGLPAGLTLALRYSILLLLAALALGILLRPAVVTRRVPGTPVWAMCLYAAFLGVGFMCVEIPLIQRFILVLGEPTTALVVVLATILTAGGAGSYLAGRIFSRRSLTGAPLLVTFITLLLWLVLPRVQLALLGLPQVGAIAGAIAVLLPIGLSLGAPFPLGLRLASETAPDSIALLLAVSAGFSMLGSVLAAITAVQLGFGAVLLIGAGCYLAGAVVIHLTFARTIHRSQTASSPARAATAGGRR